MRPSIERALAGARELGVLEVFADFLFRNAVEHGSRDLDAELFAGPAQVRLQHLPDVHARRHAQRIQADFDRRAVRQERHVFFGHDLGDHTLVAVAAGHLVTDFKLLLGGDVDLDLLDRAGAGVFAGFDAGDLAFAVALQLVELRLVGADDLHDLDTNR